MKKSGFRPSAWVFSLSLLLGAAGQPREQNPPFTLTPDQSEALARISAGSMRGHLSFIASDALEGRDTPSAGLEIAAEYIAAQFRRSGLEPAGDDGYFQSSRWTMISPNPKNFRFTLTDSGKTLDIPASKFSMLGIGAASLDRVAVVKIPFEEHSLRGTGAVEGKAVITELPATAQEPPAASHVSRRTQEFINRVAALRPAAIVGIDRGERRDSGYFSSRAVRHPEFVGLVSVPAPPLRITVDDASVNAAFDAMAPGDTHATISLNLSAPLTQEAVLRNVIGLLQGSDPVLKDSYILLSAHYDHLGTRPQLEGDNIWNGANDNGSGTVSVIEIASALATLRERPRRSIAFVAFFGEEHGLLGSRFYAKHPVFPLEKTAAAINLEQVGRTDSPEGDQHGKARITGFDYSEVSKVIRAAGEQAGISVYKDGETSDDYFSRSDNQALADVGIPSHTLCVAFDYPDYHRPTDHWDKIDYENMARTDRMVALALLMLAQDADPPRWNANNPRAARYLKAREEKHPETQR